VLAPKASGACQLGCQDKLLELDSKVSIEQKKWELETPKSAPAPANA